jgi:heptosyltransferase-2
MWPLTDPRIAEREFERIVVRVPNWLGDQIMATPALDAVRARYPRAHIAAHGGRGAQMLFEGGAWFDDFLVSGRREGARAQARLLEKGAFDACLLLTGSFRTALPPLLAGIPHRIGYRWSGRTPLLTAHWRRPRPGGRKAPYPTKLYFLDLVARLGASGGGRIHLPLTDASRARADAWLEANGIDPSDPLLLMCVGAKFGPSKLWPAEYFARTADFMTEKHGARVVILCAPGEEEIGAAVRSHARLPLVDTGLDPLTVEVLKALIARARTLLTNDTGPRHIAASFLRPVVCVMGSTDPTYTDTDLESQVVLREKDLACSPCHFKVCPIDHRCMVRLTPERVTRELESAWNSPAALESGAYR